MENNEILDQLLGLALNESEKSAIEIWAENFYYNFSLYDNDPKLAYEAFGKEYIAEYKSKEEFAWGIAREIWRIPESLEDYIDIEGFADDLFNEDYWYRDGHVFRR